MTHAMTFSKNLILGKKNYHFLTKYFMTCTFITILKKYIYMHFICKKIFNDIKGTCIIVTHF